MNRSNIIKYLMLCFITTSFYSFGQTPMAAGKIKFVGNVSSRAQAPEFNTYWNQVTPENAGKWGSVEGVRDSMNWGGAEEAYNLARSNGFPFKWHVMVWGNQQPSWIEDLSIEEQREEIEEWFAAVSKKFPRINMIEIVNEPLHDPPSQKGSGGGNYAKALGGDGETGWDWILESFRLGRKYFPRTKLVLNDYGIVNSDSSTIEYVKIIKLLQKENLIDHVGVQAHAFSLKGDPAKIASNLDKIAACGLPMYVTELDIDGPNDQKQLNDFKNIFPILYEHPSIAGITFWGYRPGGWRTRQGAHFIRRDSTHKPAMNWLIDYVKNHEDVLVSGIYLAPENGVKKLKMSTGNLQMSAKAIPYNASLQVFDWRISDREIATISNSGLLTPLKTGKVTITARALDRSGVRASFEIEIIE